MATFSVLLLTAAPPGQPAEAGGAFVKIDGREVMLKTIDLFLNRDNVTQIQVCFLPDEVEEAKRKYNAHLSFSGVKVLSGGPRWMDQVAAAAGTINPQATHVILHDAARPAVPHADIESLMHAASKHPAVTLVAPMRTPLIEVDEGGGGLAIHPAGRFMQLLMPQVFSADRFAEMASSRQEPHASQLKLLRGSPLNQRVGGPGDAAMVKALINMLPKPKLTGPRSPFEEAQW